MLQTSGCSGDFGENIRADIACVENRLTENKQHHVVVINTVFLLLVASNHSGISL